MLLLVGTSLLVAFASVVAATRLYSEELVERALAAGTLWLGLTFGCVGVLGYGQRLTRANLVLLAIASSCSVVLAGLAPQFRERGSASLRALGSLMALPLSALRAGIAQRSVGFVGVVAILVVLLYTAWLSYFAPSCSWDGTWYHETIVGLAIQEHGFRQALLPEYLELVNGYPRGGEHFSIWFALLGDRRLIELPQTAAAPVMIGAFYLLARRVGAGAASALGYAAVMLLVPGYLFQLRSTYVDATVVTLYLAALAFATRPVLRARELVLTGLCLGMLAASKQTGVVMAAVLGSLALGRALLALRGRASAERTRIAVALLCGFTLVCALGAPVYVGNWAQHRNPVWPVSFELPLLGVKFEGPSIEPVRGLSAAGTFNTIFLLPKPGTQFADIRDGGYGLALPWLALPLAVAALGLAVFKASRTAARPRSLADPTLCLLAIVIPTLATLVLSPAIWWARFNLHAAAAVLLLVAWLFSQRRWIEQGLLGTLLAIELLGLLWYTPKWEIGFRNAFALMSRTPEQRAAFHCRSWNMPEATALARESELASGDVLAFTEPGVAFPGTLWNERFDNRVVYVPAPPPKLIAALDAQQAKWVVAAQGSPAAGALQGSPFFELVGPASKSDLAFRRRPPAFASLTR